jgi:hypothetical protein
VEGEEVSRYIDANALKIPSEEMIAKMIINSAPSIDIVRCKDCKYWNYEMSGCKRNPSVVAWRDDDFCSYGEREGER